MRLYEFRSVLAAFLTNLAVLIGVCTLVMWLCVYAYGKDRLPFETRTSEKVKWEEARAVKIFHAARRLAAQELNPTRPKDLKPEMILVLGEKHAHGDCMETQANGPTRVWMKEWDEGKWAYAVITAAIQVAIDSETRMALARRTLQNVNMTVDIRELGK